jgi:hypothetical protein
MTQQQIETLVLVSKPLIESNEGRIPYLYLDAGVNPSVTCGVGHKVAEAGDVLNIPFDPPASLTDYYTVLEAKRGQFATFYKNLTVCRLSGVAIDKLLDSDTRMFVDGLVRSLPQLVDWPLTVQEGCVDLAYNVGLGGFSRYVKLIAACNAGDWATAAYNSFRNGLGDTPQRMGSRNQKTYNLFMSAVKSNGDST